MDGRLDEAARHFIEGMSRIAEFWGFPRSMGSAYGAIYLSPEPMTLDDLVESVGISKGAASTNVRSLERLQMIHKSVRVGDRKDYYEAETDHWKIIKNILMEREKQEFERALRTVAESLEIINEAGAKGDEKQRAVFYTERIKKMEGFFRTIDGLVATFMAIDELKTSTIGRLLGKK